MFDTNPRDLKELLKAAHEGSLQLPEFQRGYVWAEDDVKSLIASVAKGFPVGALLTLESGGIVNLELRTMEGSPAVNAGPEQLLLDGQQRITSLYQALWSKAPMVNKSRKDQRKGVKRFFYIDIPKAIAAGADIEDAVLPVREDRRSYDNFKVGLDLSNPEGEFEADAFPLNQVFDPLGWIIGWLSYWQKLGVDRNPDLALFKERVLDVIGSYKMPVIKLPKSSSREAICLIFEKVNVGGKKLDAFELATAIFAGAHKPIDLRRDWGGAKGAPGRLQRILQGPSAQGHPNANLAGLRPIEFLQAVSLVHTRAERIAAEEARPQATPPQISCKRDAILALGVDDFSRHADAVEGGFRFAGRFLIERKVLWQPDVPYPAQIVALAVVRAALGKAADGPEAKDRLARWFWSTALSEDYGTSPETKLAKDADELVGWVAGRRGPPERMALLAFNGNRLDTLRTRLAAAYKALSALLLDQGARDFMTGGTADIYTFGQDPMDIHHIFPKAWCETNGIAADRMDSIVNKAPLLAQSNRAIGGAAPFDYLRRIEQARGITEGQMDDILRSHLIDTEALRANNFEAFYAKRKAALTRLALMAMGQTSSVLFESSLPADEPMVDLSDIDPEPEAEAA